MRAVGLIIILITTIALAGSCMKESIRDYVPYAKDTINNPEGLLEDYGAYCTATVDYELFRKSNWMVTVVTESSAGKVYYMDTSTTAMYGFDIIDPANWTRYEMYFYEFGNYYGNKKPVKVKYVILNGDPKLSGDWFKYGNSSRLILAKRGVTLIITKR